MENASKAIIMAGTILISILVISLLVFAFNNGAKLNSEYDSQAHANELVKFNSKFEVYNKKDNTYFDLITVSNLAWDENKKNRNDSQNSITVTIKLIGWSPLHIINNKTLKKNYFLEGYMYNSNLIEKYAPHEDPIGSGKYVPTFSCKKVIYNDITGKIKHMEFEQNT